MLVCFCLGQYCRSVHQPLPETVRLISPSAALAAPWMRPLCKQSVKSSAMRSPARLSINLLSMAPESSTTPESACLCQCLLREIYQCALKRAPAQLTRNLMLSSNNCIQSAPRKALSTILNPPQAAARMIAATIVAITVTFSALWTQRYVLTALMSVANRPHANSLLARKG